MARRPAFGSFISNWSESDLRLAAYLMRSGLLAGDLDQPLAEAEIEETLFQLAVFLLENPAADQMTGQVIGIGDHWTQWDVGQGE